MDGGGVIHFSFGLPQGPPGNDGPQGPPFGGAQVDTVSSGSAAASAYMDGGGIVHFDFTLEQGPQGEVGPQGPQGDPGPAPFSYTAGNVGTGVSQAIGHTLGSTPNLTFAIPASGHDGSGNVGNLMPSITYDGADSSNVYYTVSSGAIFHVYSRM
jgi:hypothetical protein